MIIDLNPLKPELNPISYLLALLAHHFLHVSRIRVKSLTLRLLMSYIYIYNIYLIAIAFTPGGSNTVHINTQTIHRITQSAQTVRRTTQLTN